MPPARALAAYLIYVFVGAAILAPWVFHGLAAMGVSAPFRRVTDRCLLGLALLGLWPLVRALGVRTVAEIGWRKYSGFGRDIGRGLAIGTALLVAAAASGLWAGAFAWVGRPAGEWVRPVLTALASAAIVAILEETLFRGAIFTALRKGWNDTAALWTSSGIYAIVHFFARPANPQAVEWHSGFLIRGEMLRGFTDARTVIPGFLSLTLLGLMLALAYRRTGALHLSMGIHAALIFWSKLFAVGADAAPGANRWFWGSEKLTDGWFCFALLLAGTVWMWRAQFKPR